MALANKKYTAVHSLTGSNKDLLKDEFDAGYLNKIADTPFKEPAMTALVYQMGLIQEELDEVRRFIVSDIGSTSYDNKIKVLPNEFMSNDDASYERVLVEDDTANSFSIRPGSSAIEMYAMIEIPKGKKVTHGQVYASQNRSSYFYDVNYTTGAATLKQVGVANSNIHFYNTKTSTDTYISSTATNYLLIKVNTTSTSDKIYGAELTIADI